VTFFGNGVNEKSRTIKASLLVKGH